MNGGELIGQGSYGCVFDPPLLCENSNVRPKDKVSKLLEKKDAAAEIRENNKINKIDPKFKWHLKSDKSCIPKIPAASDYISDCDIISTGDLINIYHQQNDIPKSKQDNSVLKPYRNIIQEHGGTSVSNYITQKPGTFSNKKNFGLKKITNFIKLK